VQHDQVPNYNRSDGMANKLDLNLLLLPDGKLNIEFVRAHREVGNQ
jgi:hypothetical protein